MTVSTRRGNLRRLLIYLVLLATSLALVTSVYWIADGKYSYYNDPFQEYSPRNRNGFQGLESDTFFLETSGRGEMSLRQLLGVEAAARNLRDLRNLNVYIVTEGKFKKSEIMLALEARYSTLKFSYITTKNLLRGSILESWYKTGVMKNSTNPVEHISDALRLVVLWAKGGLYLDLDIILQRWITFPNNTLMWETEEFIANAMLAFKPKHPFIKSNLDHFLNNFIPVGYTENGPELVTKLYKKCKNCDIVVLPMPSMTPLHWTIFKEYFDEKLTKSVLDKSRESYGIHYGNRITKRQHPQLSVNSTCAFAAIARLNCPIVWSRVEAVGWV